LEVARAATGATSNLIGGALVATMTLAGAVAIFSLRQRAQPQDALGIVLLATQFGLLGLFFLGTLVAGGGFGAGFLGSVRATLPLALAHERAGLMATFYVLSYLAFCVPAFIAGAMVQRFGLIATTTGYALCVIALCSLAWFNLMRQRATAEVKGS
jgi:hypothetical protein